MIENSYKKANRSRVTSDFFVARHDERNRLREYIINSSGTRVCCVHSIGLGGIGKTQLLLKALQECKQLGTRILCTETLIDFYQTESRTKMGVMRRIANELGKENTDFLNFHEQSEKLLNEEDSENWIFLFEQAENAFYCDFSNLLDKGRKNAVIFFDTYEVIQGTDLSHWLETEFISKLHDRSRVVISGRQRLQHTMPKVEIKLEPFSLNDTIEFWESIFDKESIRGISHYREVLGKIYELAGGRPVLLALFVDWVRYEHNPLYPNQFISEIERNALTDANPELKKKQLFENALIQRIADLKSPADTAVAYMAFAHRRMTVGLLAHIMDRPIDECEKILFSELKPLSFIKSKENERTVLLHDEMRDLILRIWWESQDSIGNIRKSIAKKVKKYYDKWLIKNRDEDLDRRAVFQAERLYYLLYFDLSKGLSEFTRLFQRYLRENKLDLCGLFLNEINQYYNQYDSIDQLRIDHEKMRFLNEQYRSNDVLLIHDEIKKNKKKQSELEQDDSLKADITRQLGIAYLWINDFTNSIEQFQFSEKKYRTNRMSKYLHSVALNWLGYAYYRKGSFNQAEPILKNAAKNFLHQSSEEYSKAGLTGEYIDISNVYSNLASTYRFSGRFYEGAMYSAMAASVVKLKNKQREYARFCTALAAILAISNRSFEAEKALEKADAFLEVNPDPILSSRSSIVYGILKSKYAIFYNYIVETFLIGRPFEDASEFFRSDYTQRSEKKDGAKADVTIAEKYLKKALDLLGRDQDHPKSELADTYYFLAALYISTGQWNQARTYFSKCEDVAEAVRNDYWRFQAMVGKMLIDYLQEKNNDFEEQYRRCMNTFDKAQNAYDNVLGKAAVIRGNYLFNRWLKLKELNDFKEAIRQYIIASDHMLRFTDINKDRFYNVLYTIVKRVGETPIEILPPIHNLEELEEIWLYDEESRLKVCYEYSDFFQDILEFAVMRKQLPNECEGVKEYCQKLKQISEKFISDGRQFLQQAPIYAKMRLQIEIDSGELLDIAEARHWLAHCHAANYKDFEVLYNDYSALKLIHEMDLAALSTDKRFEAELLKARIYIRLGATHYRHGQYSKAIESYRAMELEENLDDFLKNQKELDLALDYLNKAGQLLDQCGKDVPCDSEQDKRVRFARTHQKFRLAEYYLITSKKGKNGDNRGKIEALYREAIEDAERSGNFFRKINAIESLIAFFYYYREWEQKEDTIIHNLLKEFKEATEEEPLPIISGRLEITLGNVHYDQAREIDDRIKAAEVKICKHYKKIREIEEFIKTATEKLEGHLRNAFAHYIEASRHKHGYSYKSYYEVMGVILDRIASLQSEESIKIMKDKIFPILFRRSPRSEEAENAQELINIFLGISRDKKYISGETGEAA